MRVWRSYRTQGYTKEAYPTKHSIGSFQLVSYRLFPEPRPVLTGKEPWLCTTFHSDFHNCAGTLRKRRYERVELLHIYSSSVPPVTPRAEPGGRNRNFLYIWRDSIALYRGGKIPPTSATILVRLRRRTNPRRTFVLLLHVMNHKKSSRLKNDRTIFYHPPGNASVVTFRGSHLPTVLIHLAYTPRRHSGTNCSTGGMGHVWWALRACT